MDKQASPPVHTSHEPVRNSAEVKFDTQREAAAYVAALVMELRQIAKSAQLDKVAASLEQAYYDAFNISNNRNQLGHSEADDQPARRAAGHN